MSTSALAGAVAAALIAVATGPGTAPAPDGSGRDPAAHHGSAGGRAPGTVADRVSPGVYVLPGSTGVFPEGITLDRRSDTFYVTSSGAGTVYRGRVGRPTAQVFLPAGTDGRTTAVGVAVRDHLLYVAGGTSGRLWVYDTRTRALVRRFDTGTGGLLNDVAVTASGEVFVTDSFRPTLWRVPARAVAAGRGDTVALTTGIDLAGRIPYAAGSPSSNGIVAVDGGPVLVVVQNTTGQLFRIDTRIDRVQEVDLHGYSLRNGDGLALRGRTLHAVRNVDQVLVSLRLSPDVREARLLGETGDPSFRLPTTLALRGGSALVVNSQLDRFLAGLPGRPPFTVSTVRLPVRAGRGAPCLARIPA